MYLYINGVCEEHKHLIAEILNRDNKCIYSIFY